jgi:glycosyltransferase involved in cell wall biosynthesis
MKDVLLITNYWHFECEKASSRYFTLAKKIVLAGIDLEVITSTFYHATKTQRNYTKDFLGSFPYKVSLIHESGYGSNVSLKRILSHKEFAKNVIEYIKKRKKPDLIYCVIPSLDVAYMVTKYANKNNIKVIIDIQDLWPETYKMIFNVPIISDIVFYPMKRIADKAYSAADEIVAVSQTYVDRALRVNKKCNSGYSIFLGAELSKFDTATKGANSINKPSDELWIAYIGTLSYSYDIPSIIKALTLLQEKNGPRVKFMVMGDGPLRKDFEKLAKEKGINCEFKGQLEYTEMVKFLCKCDIAVNPIVGSSAASIVNKVGDYAAAGLPVINTQDCKEYKDLLNDYNAGLNCKNGDIKDIALGIEKLCKDATLRNRMGNNNRRFAEERFDRDRTYEIIVDLIKKV